jgi:hypothetical protein
MKKGILFLTIGLLVSFGAYTHFKALKNENAKLKNEIVSLQEAAERAAIQAKENEARAVATIRELEKMLIQLEECQKKK